VEDVTTAPDGNAARFRAQGEASLIHMLQLATERCVRFCPERLHETHLFLRPTAASTEIEAQVPGIRSHSSTDADAEAEAASAQFIEGGRLFCNRRRPTLRENQTPEVNPILVVQQKRKPNKANGSYTVAVPMRRA
jgi:hypothetical protein